MACILGNLLLSVLLLAIAIRIGRYHVGVISKNLGNLPPVLTNPIRDLRIEPGCVTEFVFNTDTFSDPDEGDALRYVAYLNDSEQWPPWVQFDGLQRKFIFSPGPMDQGRIRLSLVARDYDGLTTESRLEVDISQSDGLGRR